MIYNEEENRVYLDYDNKEEIDAFDSIQTQFHSLKEEFGKVEKCEGLDCSGISCSQCPVGYIRRTLYDIEAYLQKIKMG